MITPWISTTTPVGAAESTQDAPRAHAEATPPSGSTRAKTGDTGRAPSSSARPALDGDRVTAQAAITTTYTVNTTADTSPADSASTTCADDVDGACSLRAAIEAADANPNTIDRIVVPAGTYVLSLGSLDANSDMVIDGAGAGATIIDGADEQRVFQIGGGSVHASGMSVQNGIGEGAGFLISFGAATLNGVSVVDNDADDNDGGAIAVDSNGLLWLTGSTLARNAAYQGGGLRVAGSAFVSDTVIEENRAEDGSGGGIYVDEDANLTIEDSIVRNNVVEGDYPSGGGIENDGITTITRGSVSGNRSTSTYEEGEAWSGGIDNSSLLRMTGTVVSGNRAEGGYAYGGGLSNWWDAQLKDVAVDGNVVVNSRDNTTIEGAGIYNEELLTFAGGRVNGNSARAAGSQTFTDGVTTPETTVDETTTPPTLTSEAANFVPSDNGKTVTGEGIPADTTITEVVDEETVRLSRDVPAATGVDFTIVDRFLADVFGGALVNYGNATFDGTSLDGNVADTRSVANENRYHEVEGGAIANWTNLVLKGVTIANTSATGDYVYGGAVMSVSEAFDFCQIFCPFEFGDGGSLSVQGVNVRNTVVNATDGVQGGAIVNWSEAAYDNLAVDATTVTLTDEDTDDEGDDEHEVYGGAVYQEGEGFFDSSGSASISNTTVSNTKVTSTDSDASVYGGAIGTDDPTNLTNVTVSATTVALGPDGWVEGGALLTWSGGSFTDVRVTGTTVTTGTGGDVEGAGWYNSDYASMRRLNVSGNTATVGDYAAGGGLLSWEQVLIEESTIANNRLTAVDDEAVVYGAGLYLYSNDGPSTVTNVTISGNRAEVSGNDSESEGGGVYAEGDVVTFSHVTIAGNFATGYTGDDELEVPTPASGADAGAAIYAEDFAVFKSSIVAGNTPAVSQCDTGTIEEDEGTIESVGYNIDSGSSCGFTSIGDLENTDPKLGPLQDNGGPGATHALLAGSPAIDAATAAGCPATDERGVARPQGAGCDIGAYEYQAAPPAPVVPTPTPTTPTGTPVPTPSRDGYWLVASDGGVFTFGDANFHGSTGDIKLNQPIVGMAPTPSGNGYWLVASDGGIFAFGDAVFHGSTGAIKLNQPIVAMAATPSGGGYWLVASDGGIFAFGDAPFHGSTGNLKLNKPIVGMANTPLGDGYWLVASDGGVFTFGSAVFHGSQGGSPLNQPIEDLVATNSGNGYWMVATDGGIFTHGDAGFLGSMGGTLLNKPVVDMDSSRSGNGYYEAASDGGIFAFGDAVFYGSTGDIALNKPIVGMSTLP